MKKKTKVILTVLIFILAVCAVVAFCQRDNISAFVKSMNYSDGEIDEMLKENKKKLEAELAEKYPEISAELAELTEEEEAQIASGEVTPEEIIEKKVAEIEKKQTETKKNNSAVNQQTKNENQKQNNKKSSEAVNKKIIEFYSLKAYYLGRLGQLEAGVKADYAALPEAKKNLVGKQELVSKYMSTAMSLMNQCDAKVSALLSELEGEIKANGGDLSIIKRLII